MKIDLIIYSHVFGISRQYKSVGLMFSNKLDFNSCVMWDGFYKSSHIAYGPKYVYGIEHGDTTLSPDFNSDYCYKESIEI